MALAGFQPEFAAAAPTGGRAGVSVATTKTTTKTTTAKAAG